MTNALKIKLFRILWSIGSGILLISGVMHVYGIFFSEDLSPNQPSLIDGMKNTSIQMDPTGTIWNLWIGFHAMFGICLIFMALSILYLLFRYHELFSRQRFLLVLTILTIASFVWIGYRYLIQDFLIGMSIPFLLFITGFFLTSRWKINKPLTD